MERLPATGTTELVLGDSAVYPRTTRRAWVHATAGCSPDAPASLLVLQDGAGFLDPDDLRTALVLDRLAQEGAIAPTVAVFVDPGTHADADPTARRNRQRNLEYDAPDDRYATFLVDEVLPLATSRWPVTDDHERWAIAGFSSGGNAALTAAWHRPDVFTRVASFSGSFAQMPGGNPYPALIPTVDRLPLHVHLHVGRRDLGWDEPEHNWFAENLRVAAALAEAAYDVRLVVGDGGHDSHDAGLLWPDVLRWLYRPPG